MDMVESPYTHNYIFLILKNISFFLDIKKNHELASASKKVNYVNTECKLHIFIKILHFYLYLKSNVANMFKSSVHILGILSKCPKFWTIPEIQDLLGEF